MEKPYPRDRKGRFVKRSEPKPITCAYPRDKKGRFIKRS